MPPNERDTMPFGTNKQWSRRPRTGSLVLGGEAETAAAASASSVIRPDSRALRYAASTARATASSSSALSGGATPARADTAISSCAKARRTAFRR